MSGTASAIAVAATAENIDRPASAATASLPPAPGLQDVPPTTGAHQLQTQQEQMKVLHLLMLVRAQLHEEWQPPADVP
jgi:hypothetical protein